MYIYMTHWNNTLSRNSWNQDLEFETGQSDRSFYPHNRRITAGEPKENSLLEFHGMCTDRFTEMFTEWSYICGDFASRWDLCYVEEEKRFCAHSECHQFWYQVWGTTLRWLQHSMVGYSFWRCWQLSNYYSIELAETLRLKVLWGPMVKKRRSSYPGRGGGYSFPAAPASPTGLSARNSDSPPPGPWRRNRFGGSELFTANYPHAVIPTEYMHPIIHCHVSTIQDAPLAMGTLYAFSVKLSRLYENKGAES